MWCKCLQVSTRCDIKLHNEPFDLPFQYIKDNMNVSDVLVTHLWYHKLHYFS